MHRAQFTIFLKETTYVEVTNKVYFSTLSFLVDAVTLSANERS